MLSKTAEYALRAVVYLAGQEFPKSADSISRKTKVPRRYLNRVLQDLVSAQILFSRSGPGGGYGLSESPRRLTILRVVNVVSPVERIRHCPLGLKTHHRLCPLHHELDRVYADTEKALSRVTIQQLLESTNPVVPLCEL